MSSKPCFDPSRPRSFWKVSRPPGAAQTPQINDFRPAKNHVLKTQVYWRQYTQEALTHQPWRQPPLEWHWAGCRRASKRRPWHRRQAERRSPTDHPESVSSPKLSITKTLANLSSHSTPHGTTARHTETLGLTWHPCDGFFELVWLPLLLMPTVSEECRPPLIWKGLRKATQEEQQGWLPNGIPMQLGPCWLQETDWYTSYTTSGCVGVWVRGWRGGASSLILSPVHWRGEMRIYNLELFTWTP